MRALLTTATATATAIATVGSTGANFTAAQPNSGNSYAAKSDWIAPSVSMSDPGANLRGTVALAASASDAGSGIQSVTIERSPAGANSWTAVCTDSGAPYGCSFDTTTGATPDGLYDFRATATDNAGNTALSAVVANRRIDNTAPTGVTMTDPGSPLSGTVSFSGDAADTGGSGIASLKFQYRPSSGGLWLDACTATSSPYGCSFNTGAIADGSYDFQALATDNAGNTTTSSVVANRLISNSAPTVTMNDPGAYLRATVSLTASAADGDGIANVVIQRRPNGGGSWTTVCTATSSPYSCSLDTTTGATPDGLYDFQAIATDNAGSSTTSAAVLARRIDNTAPGSVTVTNPGTPIGGTRTLSGNGADGGSGIATIAVQISPSGAGSWSTACSGTTTPTSCSFDTTTVADGLYDFRTRATDRAGNFTDSASASPASQIDNTAPSVSMTAPGTYSRGTIAPAATASDGSGSGIATVAIEYKPSASGTWTPLCTKSASPYSCSLDTTAGATPDGQYDFRATATDNAGRTSTSTLTARWIDNGAPTGVTMTDPGTPLGGTKTFSGAASDSASGIASVAFQWFNGTSWVTTCTATTSPYSCQGDTTAIPDGVYSFRALASDNAGNTTASSSIASRRVDNTVPTATISDPGTNLRGTITLTATASDGTGSGVANVKIQYKTSAGSTWSDICSLSAGPYTCTLDTAPLAAGDYDFRALVTDAAGNPGTATVTNRRIDNFVRTIGSSSCGSSGDTVLIPAGGGVAVGRTIVVRFAMRAGGTGAVSVIDARGHTWTKDADVNEGTSRIVLFSTTVTTAFVANDWISVSHPSNPDASGVVAGELKDIASTGRVDAVGSGTGGSTTPSASVTTTSANDFLYGAVSSTNNRAFTEPSGWQLLSNFAMGCGGARGSADNHGASRFAASAGTFTYAPTLSSSANWADAIVAYKTQ